jgi:hypothetical protein
MGRAAAVERWLKLGSGGAVRERQLSKPMKLTGSKARKLQAPIKFGLALA